MSTPCGARYGVLSISRTVARGPDDLKWLMGVTVKLLGEPAFSVGGAVFEPPPGKASALLYYLVYKGEWVSRDELVYLFWPDSDEGAARKNLRQLLTTIRRLPYTQGLEVENTRLRWRVPTDLQQFRQALEEKDWAHAAEMFGGAAPVLLLERPPELL